MKIVRIIARLNVGGPARHVVWLTEALQNGEFESALVAGRVPPGEEDMAYVAEAAGVRPIFIEEMSRELSVKDIVSLIKVFRLLVREKPDIVHTHTAKAGTVGRAAAFLYRWLTPRALIGRPRRLAVVHTFHGHVFHSYYGKFKTSLFVLIEKMLARFATDRIIVISDQQFDEIHRRVGIGDEDQFTIIPLGIDPEPFAAATSRGRELREELAIDDSTLLIGFVGRLTEIKNIPLYLEVARAYETSSDATLPRLHFVIVGDGHLRPALEADAARLGLRSLTFLGNREEIEAVYAALDVVALTSLNEGTPLSLIEGMASRKPFISTTVGGVVDLLGPLRNGHEGFAVHEHGIGTEPANVGAFLKGLIYLVKSERLREELANKGHDFVRENYGKDRLIKDIRKLYRGLSDGNV
jgi:glycosyltransferase involved in cell wall biosynthesis